MRSSHIVRFRLLPALLVLAFTVGTVHAQSSRNGSVYSRYLVGELRNPYSSRTLAMGGAGFALGGGSHVSLANPATLGELAVTRAAAGLVYEGIRITDAAGDESELQSAALSGFVLGIPLIGARLGVGLGLTPYSRVGYLVTVDRTLTEPGAAGREIPYQASFEGNGGLDRLSLGIGYRVARYLTVGARGDFTFGILEDVQRLTFSDPAYGGVRMSDAVRLRGFSGAVGVRAVIPTPFGETDLLAFGAYVETPTHLTGDQVLAVGSSFEPDTLGTAVDGSMDLPWSVGAGVSYQVAQRFVFAADGVYQPWSQFDSSFLLPGFKPSGTSVAKDRTRLSAGFEFYPAGRDLLAGILKRTAYRLGAFVESSYVDPDPSVRIQTYGITGGVSLPTLLPGTRVDINLEAGNRGSAENMLVRDRYVRVGIHINFADRWFVRRPLG